MGTTRGSVPQPVRRYAGISAYVSAAAAVAALLLSLAARPGTFVATLAHVGGLVLFLAVVPVATGLYARGPVSVLGVTALVVGAGGGLGGGAVQALFLLGAIGPLQRAQLTLAALAVMGAWLLLASGPARGAGVARWVTLVGAAAGVTFIVTGIAARLAAVPIGAVDPARAGPLAVALALLASLAIYVAYPVWMVALGRRLRRTRAA